MGGYLFTDEHATVMHSALSNFGFEHLAQPFKDLFYGGQDVSGISEESST